MSLNIISWEWLRTVVEICSSVLVIQKVVKLVGSKLICMSPTALLIYYDLFDGKSIFAIYRLNTSQKMPKTQVYPKRDSNRETQWFSKLKPYFDQNSVC